MAEPNRCPECSELCVSWAPLPDRDAYTFQCGNGHEWSVAGIDLWRAQWDPALAGRLPGADASDA